MSVSKSIYINYDIAFSLSDEMLNKIKEVIPGWTLNYGSAEKLSIDEIRNVEIILGCPPAELLSEAKQLKWLHLSSAGADRYTDRSIYYNKDIMLTNSSGIYGIPIAEHVFGMILAFNRNLQIHIRNQLDRKWELNTSTRELYGSTVGIVGLGNLGIEIAKRSKSLGTKVIAVKRNPGRVPEYVDELYGQDGISRLMKQSDYVILTLPNTERTQGIISRRFINSMKREAFIVNVGRGTIVDQEALIDALKQKRIAGAGLDVTVPEPLPQDSPLWSMPNVIITSHTSGFSQKNRERVLEKFIHNLKLYITGQPLLNTVDFGEGY